MAVEAAPDEVLRVISTALDPAFYRTVYPDVAGGDLELFEHYRDHGWREGRDPAPWFSSAAYLAAHPDLRDSGIEPFFHFLTVGRAGGFAIEPSRLSRDYLFGQGRAARAPEPPPAEPAPAPERELELTPVAPAAEASQTDRELIASEFDATYYLLSYPDVADAGGDPLAHFLEHGWREGRDPSPDFSVDDYLQMYPDIVAAAVNPFLHYLQAGRAEGRTPKHPLGFRYQILTNTRPVTERVARVKAMRSELKTGTAEDLAQALAASRTGLKDLHITVSHDDFTANLGGVQQCLAREGARAAELGLDHLHLFPAKAWPVVRTDGETGQLGVLLNGVPAGAFKPSVAAKVLRAQARPAGRRTLAIHSLLGHRADEVAAIAEAAGLRSGFFWLHDFASLCAGYHLLRNDVQDCAAPPPDSPACSICSYLPMRARHLAEHQRLFDLLDLTVAAPSQATLDLWLQSWTYPTAATAVLPHAVLDPRGQARVSRARRPLRVAYAGMPRALKGWPVFRQLALKHRDDERYRLLHLGGAFERGLPVEFHEVSADADRPAAMREALEGLEVDVVLIWPLCRETFSFLAYESVAAGCAIVTWSDSGNVAAFVEQGGHGWVLSDEAALAEAFETGRLAELARARRKPSLYDLRFSALTFDLAAA